MSEIKTTETTNIELRSEEFQEVLGTIPPWILRWGITVVTFIVALLLVGSAIFKYPDTISASVTLTGTTPVAGVVAKTSGKLQYIYMHDNQFVEKGEYLAIIDNPANVNDILRLKEYLEQGKNGFEKLNLITPQEMNLGGLQVVYSSFYLTLSEYKLFLEQDYQLRRIAFTKDKIVQSKAQYENLLRQQKLVKQQFMITETRFRRDSTLMRKGGLSQKELENSSSQLLQGQLSLESMSSSIDNVLNQIEQSKESLFEAEHQYTDKKNTLELQLRTQYSQLITELTSWEMTYALTSSISGKITFTDYWVENQNVLAGDIVFNIVPLEEGKLIGKALLPTARSGKVAVGQKVNIRFANFPDHEYGIVKGNVSNISLVPSKGKEVSQYVIEINLPDGLKTTYKKTLPFLPEMEGQADIITDDLSVLERFLLPLRKVLTEGLN